MTTASTPEKTTAPPERATSPLAGLLSYLVPGLGQIYQGRVGKGLLFLCSLYGLFFYGMYLGHGSNVYLSKVEVTWPPKFDPLPFLGQSPIGVVAWPAIIQYRNPALMPAGWRDVMRKPPENRNEAGEWRGKSLNELQSEGDKFWDLGWVYTVIAGVLNILVIYDAYAGPALRPESESEPSTDKPEEEKPTA
jgi:TM2 domain-containing membrane protein YozV